MVNSTKTSKGFTLVELLVVISIIALLMAILMPALSKAKVQAKSVVCGSNLKQWGLIFAMYLGDYNNKFPGGSHPAGSFTGVYDYSGPGIWINAMAGYYPKDDYKIFTCPVAKRPGVGPDGKATGVKPLRAAWGMLPDSDWFIKGMYGSYGFNWHCYNATRAINRIHRWYTRNFWGHAGYRNSDEIPLFFDSTWVSVGPFDTDKPPEYSGQPPDAWPGDEMRRLCLDRHDGAINMMFMDLSMRTVGLKQLWKLRWHKAFNRDVVWDWSRYPWMKNFRNR